MNIRDFADQHGLKAIVRRHAEYNKPLLPVDSNLMCALVYSRTIDPALLGLKDNGKQMMYYQGELLVEMGLIPSLIISGVDQRNVDGAFQTALAIEHRTGQQTTRRASTEVTYPIYDATKAYGAWQKFGDMAAHMYLAGCPEVEGLWKETADAFEHRITSTITDMCPDGKLVLFDLNFEQLTLLHFVHVEKIRRQNIPYDAAAWCPKNGGGIAYGEDGTVMEFDPSFEMIIKVVE